jgi:hypothetical protein
MRVRICVRKRALVSAGASGCVLRSRVCLVAVHAIMTCGSPSGKRRTEQADTFQQNLPTHFNRPPTTGVPPSLMPSLMPIPSLSPSLPLPPLPHSLSLARAADKLSTKALLKRRQGLSFSKQRLWHVMLDAAVTHAHVTRDAHIG